MAAKGWGWCHCVIYCGFFYEGDDAELNEFVSLVKSDPKIYAKIEKLLSDNPDVTKHQSEWNMMPQIHESFMKCSKMLLTEMLRTDRDGLHNN